MSVLENIRSRVEEMRSNIQTRLSELRGGEGIALLQGGVLSGQSSGQLPLISEIREKGLLTVLEEKFPRIKEVRERGIGALRPQTGPSTARTSPATQSAPVVEEKELRPRKARVLV